MLELKERIEIVRRAQKRATEHPARHTYARNAMGWRVSPLAQEAVTWCAVGALRKEVGADDMSYAKVLGVGFGPDRTITRLIDEHDEGSPASCAAAWDALIAALPPDPVQP